MKGKNELRLNSATMQEAIQFWLINSVWKDNGVRSDVTDVGYIASERTFTVTLKGRESVSAV